MKRLALQIPLNTDFADDDLKWSKREDCVENEADWIFIESAAFDRDEFRYFPIHYRTTFAEIENALNDPDFPQNAKIVIIEP